MSGKNSKNIEEYIKNLSQMQYEFDSSALSPEEIKKIKSNARINRADFGTSAPVGKNIFDLMQQTGNIIFVLQKFKSQNLDAMIVSYKPGSERKYVILNSKKPLINQIFAAAHEYYHYLYSFQNQVRDSIVCSFDKKEKEEIKANRFAAEFLLPSQALDNEIDGFLRYSGENSLNKLETEKIAVFLFALTLKYELPLKAVMYRLKEEKKYKDIDFLIKNYSCIKDVFLKLVGKQPYVKELYSNKNTYINQPVYNLLQILYEKGKIEESDVNKITKQFNISDDFTKSILKDDTKDTLSDPNYKIDFGEI